MAHLALEVTLYESVSMHKLSFKNFQAVKFSFVKTSSTLCYAGMHSTIDSFLFSKKPFLLKIVGRKR